MELVTLEGNILSPVPAAEKKGRGRPRKHPVKDENTPKRSRGRPRKYPISEKQKLPNGEVRISCKKVDSGHLVKHMLDYFTKLLIIHGQMTSLSTKDAVLFNRLKNLDFQMAEVCKTILASEYKEDIAA